MTHKSDEVVNLLLADLATTHQTMLDIVQRVREVVQEKVAEAQQMGNWPANRSCPFAVKIFRVTPIVCVENHFALVWPHVATWSTGCPPLEASPAAANRIEP